jgi:hypothetical protein
MTKINRTSVTGGYGLAHPRIGFSDYDAFRAGFIARDTWTGNLDAPDYMPQGSMLAGPNIGKHGERASIAHRDHDTGYRPLGACHDGSKQV